MAMVGLFWIAADGGVFVGAEPEGYGRGVRLTRDGLEGLGTDQGGGWAWLDVRSVAVRDVRVRTAARLLVTAAIDVVGSAAMGGGEAAAAFEVHVETAKGTVELGAYAAPAVGGYVQSEYDLSIALLEGFVAGTADVGDLAEWGRAHAGEGTLRREEREALLRTWAGA